MQGPAQNEYSEFMDIVLDSPREAPSLLNLDLNALSLALDEPFSKAADLGTLPPSSPTSIVDSLDDPFVEAQKKEVKAPVPSLAQQKNKDKKPVAKAPAVPDRKATRSASPSKKKIEFDDERAKKIFRTYVAARQRCNEPTGNVTLEKVVKSLNKQFDEKGGGVDFKVVIRNGKAAIKTVKK
jgi:hypothetical protein